MKHEVPFRIIVDDPVPGVVMKIQEGRDKLVDPVSSKNGRLVFEFSLQVDLQPSVPNFLGPFAQGPKDGRFVYVNSGTYAGQLQTCWARRAKLPLVSISKDLVESVLASAGCRIETTISGTGRDGGPVCASIKGLEWRIAGQ